jgi:hypothetical protein
MVPVHFLSTLLSRSRPAPGQPAQASSVPERPNSGKRIFLQVESIFSFWFGVLPLSCGSELHGRWQRQQE